MENLTEYKSEDLQLITNLTCDETGDGALYPDRWENQRKEQRA